VLGLDIEDHEVNNRSGLGQGRKLRIIRDVQHKADELVREELGAIHAQKLGIKIGRIQTIL
jgi:hypothetical protein